MRDDCGRELTPPAAPQRIVSLCPSISETIVALGAGARLVGRTRYCIHPAAEMAGIPEVGGTKNPRLAAIRALQPDLIIAEKEENRAEDVAALQAIAPVYVFDIVDLDSALQLFTRLGELLRLGPAARQMRAGVETAWAALPRLGAHSSCLYFIWRRPWMVVGQGTYIDAVLGRLGLQNLGCSLEGRYPELSEAALRELAPQRVLLSSEPYPFSAGHARELQAIWPQARIELVDGEMYSWYGARMQPAARQLAAALNGGD